jgi:hypothetical protein
MCLKIRGSTEPITGAGESGEPWLGCWVGVVLGPCKCGYHLGFFAESPAACLPPGHSDFRVVGAPWALRLEEVSRRVLAWEQRV